MLALLFVLLCSCHAVPWTPYIPPRTPGVAPICCTDNNADTSLFQGPTQAGLAIDGWREQLLDWREKTANLANLSDAVYSNPRLNWTRRSYVQPQVHLFDRFLYDREKHEFTVLRYLNDLENRYGGIDSVLLWPTYPNIGLDDRNQFDMWRAIPGGMNAITNVTAEFHKAGVKVLWGYNPWDEGLRPENPSSSGGSEPQWTTMARLLKQTK
jgi:hypothetical protein